jgi:hypothetical protein
VTTTTRSSRVRALYLNLRSRGFEVSEDAPDVTLSVTGKFDAAQMELLAEMVADHGASMTVDERRIFEIWFDPNGPHFANPY